MNDLTLIKQHLIRILQSKPLSDWFNCRIILEFPPNINKGHKGRQFFWNKEGENVRNVVFFDEAGLNDFFKYIIANNQLNQYNIITFESKKDDYENATIEISFNQEVEDTFRNNLPKSWRKKTIIPWWKNPEETKGLE